MASTVPKRANEKLGHMTKAQKADRESRKAPGAEHVPVPETNPDWHPIAKRWFEALKESGQSQFYEPSDWAIAEYVAHGITNNLNTEGRISPTLFANVLQIANAELMSTEGSRRRLHLELQRPSSTPEQEPRSVAAIKDYKNRIAG